MHIINPMRHAMSIAVLSSLLVGNLHSATFTVINTNDAGAGSLRAAITSANGVAGPHTIRFDIPTSDPGFNPTDNTWTIQPVSDLPKIVQAVTITGYTFGGATYNTATPNTLPVGNNAVLKIILNGSNYTVGNGETTGNGLVFAAGSTGSIVTGLVINEWVLNGILLNGELEEEEEPLENIQIVGNFIGTDASGTEIHANRTGIGISGITNPVTNVTIGTPAAADRNIIAGSFGFFISDEYGIRGACICSNNTSADGDTGNIIQNNYVGTDNNGTSALTASQCGIMLIKERAVTIGGALSTERNLISGHDIYGIYLTGDAPYEYIVEEGSGCQNCTIQGNYIGTTINGTAALANQNAGIALDSATIDTVIANNLISGNGTGIRIGVLVMPETTDTFVQGNLIGADITGTKALGNTNWGIIVSSNSNTIGGDLPAYKNIISANAKGGILLHSADENTIEGNFIGADYTGTKKLGNGGPGIQLGIAGDYLAANSNQIGA